jgi:tetratricopeptide (TPR) repeat protein
MNNLGARALAEGRLDEAEAFFRGALAAKPELAATRRNLAAVSNNRGLGLLAAGRAREALAEFDRAARHDPAWHLPLFNRGNAFAAQGRHREASRDYEAASRLEPGFVEAWLNAGNARARLGDLAGALTRYERALALDPGNAAAASNAAAVRRALRMDSAERRVVQ